MTSATMQLLKQKKASAETTAEALLEAELGGTENPMEEEEEIVNGEDTEGQGTEALIPPTAAEINSASTLDLATLIDEFGLIVSDGYSKLTLAKKRAVIMAFFYPPKDAIKEQEAMEPPGSGTATPTTEVAHAPEIIPADLLSKTAKDIENIKSAEEASSLVLRYLDEADFNEFKVGGLLSVIQANGWWKGEHPNFKEFILAEFGLQYRKAMYLINIYNSLLDAGVSWEMVKGIGWTKLKEISGYLSGPDAEAWIEKAKAMTAVQLTAEIAHMKAQAAKGDGADSTPAEKVKTKTFKVHPDQEETIKLALESAASSTGSDVDTVNLEHICLDYLSGFPTLSKSKTKTKPEPATSTPAINAAGWPEDMVDFLKGAFTHILDQETDKVEAVSKIFQAFEGVFPEVNITVDMGD